MISFIIPTLNEEKLLPTLLKQLFSGEVDSSHYEVIISDGGSTDGTLQIAETFPVRVVENSNEPENIPIGKNRGAKISSGDILVFITADIVFDNLKLFIETVHTKLKEKTVALTFPVKVIANERRLSDIVFHGFYNRYFRFINLIGIGFGRGECQVIKRDTFNELNGFREFLFAGEDFDLFLRAGKVGKIKYCNNSIIYESPRRYRKIGYLGIIKLWTRNALSVLQNKDSSFSKKWEPIR